MIQDDDIEQEMLDKALCFVCHRQMVDGNCPVCDDPETYKENAMTPEQIEKEREAFESYIMATYTDPKTGVLKQDWNLKRDGEGYFWRNPSTAWKAWIARATQNGAYETEDVLNKLAAKMEVANITFMRRNDNWVLLGCMTGDIYGVGITVVDCLNDAISKGNL